MRVPDNGPGANGPVALEFSYTKSAASLKLNVYQGLVLARSNWTTLRSLTTGNVNFAPDATVAGRVAGAHWNMEEVIAQLGFVSAAFAVQVT